MTEKPIIVVGGGGHARVLIEALMLGSRQILGICDPQLGVGLSGPAGVRVLGGDEVIIGTPCRDVELVNGIGSTATTAPRDAVYRRFAAAGYRFAVVRHPSAVVARDVVLSEGVQIMAGAVLQCGVRIGANSIVNTRASVDHDCRLGESVHVAPGATLSGSVQVGDGCHLGTGAIVIQGITIGANCLVGAGVVLTRSIGDGARLPPRERPQPG